MRGRRRQLTLRWQLLRIREFLTRKLPSRGKLFTDSFLTREEILVARELLARDLLAEGSLRGKFLVDNFPAKREFLGGDSWRGSS